MKNLVVLFLALVPSLAVAHTGTGEPHGIALGFMHPVSGLDHVLAMAAVGMLAGHLGGRALWLVPLAFLAMMSVGGALGIAHVGLRYVELGIALSVIVLGMLVAARVNPPVAIAIAIVGFFAIFHGHAHGTEMPQNASGAAYAVGFIVASAMLHAVGIGFGVLAGRKPRVPQYAGTAMALAGIGMIGGLI